MKVKKVIMSNGNEYKLLWDEKVVTWDNGRLIEDSIKMIDIENGWVELTTRFISEIIEMRDIDNINSIHGPISRREVLEYYGESL